MSPPAGGSLQALLRAPPAGIECAGLAGIEQEFEVFDGDGKRDFRELLHTLAVEGHRIDPGDRNAYRLRCGLALTCDDTEAELATPPVPVRRGFTVEVETFASHARATLEGLLPPGYRVEGYSTHISIGWPGPPDEAFALRFARGAGPLFALLAEGPRSLGIYVRPRPGRLELCCDFLEGPLLRAAILFAVALVRAAAAGYELPELCVALLPGYERFSFRVLREATGQDLYATARKGSLTLADGTVIGVQAALAEAWAVVAPFVSEEPATASHLHAILAGEAPLGVEGHPRGRSPHSAPAVCLVSPHGLSSARGEGWRFEPVLATWAFVVFAAAVRGSEQYLCVPGTGLGRLPRSVAGARRLAEQTISARAAAALTSPAQTAVAGVYRSVPDPEGLLPGELEPGASGEAGHKAGRRGKMAGPRIGKILLSPPETHTPGAPIPPIGYSGPSRVLDTASLSGVSRPGWGWIAAVSGVVGAAALIGSLVFATGDGKPEDLPTPGATPTATASMATSTPSQGAATPMTAPAESPSPASSAPGGTEPTAHATETAPAATVTPFPMATPTVRPTETAAASFTPILSPTLRPTETPVPTQTPRPTATHTPTPSPSPTPTIVIVLPETPAPVTPRPGCTPSGGVTCP